MYSKIMDLEDYKNELITDQPTVEQDLVTHNGEDETESEKDSSTSEICDPDYIAASRKVFEQLEMDPSNPEWKTQRNRVLLEGILRLENPVVTEKMIDFLLQDGVCEILLGFITQVVADSDDGKVERWSRESIDEVPTELKLSYRATMLFSREDPSDALLTFLGQKAGKLAELVFQIFTPQSKGVLQHGCKLLDQLLKYHANEVYLVLAQSVKKVDSTVGMLLHHLDEPAVMDCLVKIITQPSTTQTGFYKVYPQAKWNFYKILSDWRLLSKLAKQIVWHKRSSAHASGAADALLQIVDKLATDSNGEILLQPIGHCPELLASLVNLAVGKGDRGEHFMSRRTEASRVLLAVVRKVLEDQIVTASIWQLAFGGYAQPTVPNQLKSVRDLVFAILVSHLPSLSSFFHEYQGSSDPEQVMFHPGFTVERPFSVLRFQIFEIITEIVCQKPAQLSKLSLDFWRICCQWFSQYPHNNLYQTVFHRLVFQALRSSDEDTLKKVFQKCKLVATLVYVCQTPKESLLHGAAFRLLNAIRLQVETLPPSAFLRSFLQSHETWRKFLPTLKERTIQQQHFGLGFTVPTNDLISGSVKEEEQRMRNNSIDLGSRLARSLGFEDAEIAWPSSDGEISLGTPGSSSKNRKKKKKSRSSHGGTKLGYPESEDHSLNLTEEKEDHKN